MSTLTETSPPAAERSPAGPSVGPCRLCKAVAYGGDADGPVHACCFEWRAAIAAGLSCPACDAARLSRARGRIVPPRLPRKLPDGRPLVPGLPVTPDQAESAAC